MFSLLVLCFVGLFCTYEMYIIEGYNYEPWTDIFTTNRNTSHLFCPTSRCNEEIFIKHREKCCRCLVKPIWELLPYLVGSLHIEYQRRRGKSLVVSTVPFTKFQYFELVHTNGFMSELPANVCEFKKKLVKMDLSQNRMVSVENIHCLINLDSLILTENSISYLRNATFSGLSFLRVLDLSNNMIKELEPMTLSSNLLYIHIANFRENFMKTVDITNVVIENPFCTVDYSGNQISKLINTASFKIDTNKTYGNGGYIDFQSNAFQTWINFTELGFSDLALFGKIINFKFDLRRVNWTCDCNMQPFLELVKPYLAQIWRDYFNITCSNPSELSGLSIVELAKNNQLDYFICNVSTSNGCPVGCRCYEQPSQKRTVVNCTGVGFNAMPSELPAFDNIELFVNDNFIQELKDMEYLIRIQKLEIENNPLKKITLGVAKKLKHNVNLSFNCKELGSIPSTFKYLDQRKISLGLCNVACDCESKWLKDWMAARHDDSGSNVVYCKTSGGNIPLYSFDFDSLDCEGDDFLTYVSTTFAALVILLSFCGVLLYQYRFEITLLRKNPTVSRDSESPHKFDVYVIINENNRDALMWTRTVLIPKLKRAGYITYLPYTDEIFGYSKEEQIIRMLTESRDIIAILTKEFNTSDDLNTFYTNLEWRHGWNKFKDDSSERNLIVINFDQLKAREFSSSPLKAFLRLHMTLDFADRNHHLIKDVLSRLGRPSRVNRKPVYTQAHKDKSQFIELLEKNEKLDVEILKFGDLKVRYYNVK